MAITIQISNIRYAHLCEIAISVFQCTARVSNKFTNERTNDGKILHDNTYQKLGSNNITFDKLSKR